MPQKYGSLFYLIWPTANAPSEKDHDSGKNIFFNLLCVVVMMACFVAPAASETFIAVTDSTEANTNPQRFLPANPYDGKAPPRILPKLTYDDPTVEIISEDRYSNPPVDVSGSRRNAILNYDFGLPSFTSQDQLENEKDGNFILEVGDFSDLHTHGPGHASYSEAKKSLPLAVDFLLLGFCLIFLAGVIRKLKK